MYLQKLSQAVEEYVRGIFSECTDPVLVFHNLTHTLRVVSRVQEIVCDADLYHFGTEALFERDELMKKEVELRYGKQIAAADWAQGTIKLLESHHYHTLYCQDLLNRQKESNLRLLRELVH